MCGYAEWEKLMRSVEEAVEDEGVRDAVSRMAARIDALIDEAMAWASGPESAAWICRPARRYRPDWIA
jgi:hypothetical protein